MQVERLEDTKDEAKESREDALSGPAPGHHTSGCIDDRQLDKGYLARGVVDALGGFAKVAGLGPENVGNESLGIAVVEREPARLNLHHDAVAGQKHVIRRGKRETIQQRLVWRKGLGRFKTFTVASPENVRGNHKLIAAHFGLRAHFVGVEVDQLDDPIR